jgi:hypothetical protein
MKKSAFHFMAEHTGALILAQARGERGTAQAEWRHAVQGQFLDWLSAGGFQAGVAAETTPTIDSSKNENSGTEAAVLTSHPGTQCEELKFTRVRINDAVG